MENNLIKNEPRSSECWNYFNLLRNTVLNNLRELAVEVRRSDHGRAGPTGFETTSDGKSPDKARMHMIYFNKLYVKMLPIKNVGESKL